MSFFKKSSGETLELKNSFDSNSFELIPDNTNCVALIKNATVEHSDQYGSSVRVEWQILAPQQLKNRIIFQGIKIFDNDPKKRDRALDMFSAIDTNATGGKIVQNGKEPTDKDLSSWLQKQMMIKVMVWTMEDRKGNWVSSVMPKKQQETIQDDEDDTDIPF